MSQQKLKFDNIRVNKKKFQNSKQPLHLMSVNVDQIVVSDKYKHSKFKHPLIYWLARRWNC